VAQFLKECLRGLALRRREDRKVPLAQFQLDLDPIRDLLAPPHGLFQTAEGRVHLLRAAEEKLLAPHAHPLGVGAEPAGVDA
jgi:hypothetical protein